MKILTKKDASDLLDGKPLDAFITHLSSRLKLVEGTYSAPVKAGVQIVLSKLFAYLLLRDSPVCLYVTCWGIATEHLDLFHGYRRSLGESRPLIETPVHFFEQADEDAFISVLCMVFFFSWDASVFDTTGRSLLQTSHDGWLEIRTDNEDARMEFATELEKYAIPLLSR